MEELSNTEAEIKKALIIKTAHIKNQDLESSFIVWKDSEFFNINSQFWILK